MNYRFNTNYAYSVNIHDICLINGSENKTIILKYPEAAVFDLLIRKTPRKKIILLLANICLVTHAHAESIFTDTIEFLEQNNIILKG